MHCSHFVGNVERFHSPAWKGHTMKLARRLITVTGMAALAAAAHATPITASGITWNPDYVDGGEMDFITQFDFTQWYSTTSSVGGQLAANSYSSALVFDDVYTDQQNGGSFGTYYLQGAGEIYRINGDTGFAAAGRELTYVFGGIVLNADGTLDYGQAWGKLYAGYTDTNYTHPASNDAEVQDAQAGELFLDLRFTSASFLDGDIGNGTVSATLSIVGGTAAGYFDPRSLTYTGDANFNPAGRYSVGGNGSSLGNTENQVPEPATLGLTGLGLVGLAIVRRRRIR